MSDPATHNQEPAPLTERPPETRLPTPAEALAASEPLPIPAVGEALLPENLGRYRIRRCLGRGGMGSVYLAHDTQLDRPVALKLPHFGVDHGDALVRFYREARTAGRLQHPNICPVYDVGEVEGVHYLSMAYIEGEALSAHTREYRKRPPREAAALVRTLALALDEAHRHGVIHRDLKPSNIMMNRRGEPMVMDFGLAREVRSDSARHTHQGTILGTPAYMAPEQARGDVAAMGPGCDIYSLGVILYELLAGRVPFEGPTMEVLVQQIRDEPPPLSPLRPDLDPQLEAICRKALAKELSRRFTSMAELAQTLEDYLSGKAPLSSPQGVTGAGPSAATREDPLTPGSVTDLLGRLRSAEPDVRDEAAAAIWGRYCESLLDLACRSLDRRLQRRVGADDVVQHTFKSFFFRQQRGQYDLADRSDLLRLLVRMTLNKARGAAVKESRRRRDYRREQPVRANPADRGSESHWLLEQAKQGHPTPEDAAAFSEEVEHRLARLPEDLRRVALYKLEGYTNAEIAALPAMGCTVRTVERKLRLIREAWDAQG
jgi:serine/threonine protein kinase